MLCNKNSYEDGSRKLLQMFLTLHQAHLHIAMGLDSVQDGIA